MTDKARGDVIKGTVDMLVLQALQLGPMHGWGITELLEQHSQRVLRIGQGSLYPSLYRLERQGLVTSEWRVTENNRRARYYSLTTSGHRRLREERCEWERVSRAVTLIMQLGDA